MRKSYLGLAAAVALVLSTVAYSTPADAQRRGMHRGMHMGGGGFARHVGIRPAGMRHVGIRRAGFGRVGVRHAGFFPGHRRRVVVVHRHRRNVWPWFAAGVGVPLLAASTYGYGWDYPTYAYGGCCPCY